MAVPRRLHTQAPTLPCPNLQLWINSGWQDSTPKSAGLSEAEFISQASRIAALEAQVEELRSTLAERDAEVARLQLRYSTVEAGHGGGEEV